MRQQTNQARKLNLNKSTVARLNNPDMNQLIGGAASTRPQCDTVKPLTSVLTTLGTSTIPPPPPATH